VTGVQTCALPIWMDRLVDLEFFQARGQRAEDVALGSSHSFRHELVREAAYAMLTDDDRALGHRLAAEWMQDARPEEALSIAEHFRRGMQPRRAALWYRRAAEQALEGHDNSGVLQRVELGVESGAEGELLGALRLAEADAANSIGDRERAARAGEQAARLFPRTTPSHYRAIEETVVANLALGRMDLVAAWFERLLATEPAPEVFPQHVGCMAILAMLGRRWWAGPRLVTPLVQAVARYASNVEGFPPEMAARVASLLAVSAEDEGDMRAAITQRRRSVQCSDKAGDRWRASLGRAGLAVRLGDLGDFAGAEEVLGPALADTSSTSNDMVAGLVRAALVRTLVETRLDEARVLAAASLAAPSPFGFDGAGFFWLALAKSALLVGDFEEAERHARAALLAFESAPDARPVALGWLSRVCAAQSRHEEAVEYASRGLSSLRPTDGVDRGEALVRLAYLEALAAAGERSRALEALMEARERLLHRAARINDDSWRRSFLEQVPENAATMALVL